ANDGQGFRAVGIAGVCTDTSDAATLTVTPVSIAEVEGEPLVRIYPNPVQEQLVIEMQRSSVTITGITVTDILGRKTEEIIQPVYGNILLSVATWQPGMYFI